MLHQKHLNAEAVGLLAAAPQPECHSQQKEWLRAVVLGSVEHHVDELARVGFHLEPSALDELPGYAQELLVELPVQLLPRHLALCPKGLAHHLARFVEAGPPGSLCLLLDERIDFLLHRTSERLAQRTRGVEERVEDQDLLEPRVRMLA